MGVVAEVTANTLNIVHPKMLGTWVASENLTLALKPGNCLLTFFKPTEYQALISMVSMYHV